MAAVSPDSVVSDSDPNMNSQMQMLSTKDQCEITDDLPFLQWEHEDKQQSVQAEDASSSDKPDAITDKGSTDSMESKIDKMLKLYISLNDQIQKSVTTSKERLLDLKTAHNSLIGAVKAQRIEIVDCYIRINDMEYSHMQMQRDLVKAKNLIFDLISTVGALNPRIENQERISMDNSVEIKEKKLILAGISETKKEDVKKVALDKLKEILTKASEAQQVAGYKGPKAPML